MKKVILLFVLIMNVLFSVAEGNDKQQFYVGTFTNGESKGIYLCEFNTETEEIQVKETFAGLDNPSFLKVSKDKNFLYVVCRAPKNVEPGGGYVQAYKIGKGNKIQFLNKQITHGEDPCHVDVSQDGKYVAIANYGGGSTALYPVSENGLLEPTSSVIVNKGSSANENRQTKPHAHSIKFSPYDNQVFSADLGTDQLDIFLLQEGKLIQPEQAFVKLKAGSGPRHFDFYPNDKVIFVINELNSTITSFKSEDGQWKEFQTISTIPENFEGVNYCADIHVSADGKYLYGSNRGHNSIAAFEIDKETKELKTKGFVSVEGDWPRNFSLSPSGEHLLVANQNSSNITVFRINRESGMPEFTGKQIKIPAPVCIEFF